jgi:transposase
LTEGGGVPIGVVVEGSNRNDFKLLRETIESIAIERPLPTLHEAEEEQQQQQQQQQQGMCLDKGYDYDEVREILKEFGFTAHIRARGEEAQAIKREAGYKARRWVVERTHSWMNRFRAILIRWEKKAANFLALLHLACAYITFKQAGLMG